jgi:hypothetical protein
MFVWLIQKRKIASEIEALVIKANDNVKREGGKKGIMSFSILTLLFGIPLS